MLQKGLTPNIISYNTMMSIATKAKRLDLVHHLFQELRQSDIELNEVVWTTAISGEKISGDWKAALALLREAKESLTIRSAWPYFAVINVCLEAGEFKTPFEVYESMLCDGIKPDKMIVSSLLELCFNTKNEERLFEIYGHVTHPLFATRLFYYGSCNKKPPFPEVSPYLI